MTRPTKERIAYLNSQNEDLDPVARVLLAEIDALTAERDDAMACWRMFHKERDSLREQVSKLTAERDEWKEGKEYWQGVSIEHYRVQLEFKKQLDTLHEQVSKLIDERDRLYKTVNLVETTPENNLEHMAYDLISERDEARAQLDNVTLLNERLVSEKNKYHDDWFSEAKRNERLAKRVEGLRYILNISCVTPMLCQLQNSGPCRFCRGIAADDELSKGEK